MAVLICGNKYYNWTPLAAEIVRQLADSEWTQLLDYPGAEPTRRVYAS